MNEAFDIYDKIVNSLIENLTEEIKELKKENKKLKKHRRILREACLGIVETGMGPSSFVEHDCIEALRKTEWRKQAKK